MAPVAGYVGPFASAHLSGDELVARPNWINPTANRCVQSPTQRLRFWEKSRELGFNPEIAFWPGRNSRPARCKDDHRSSHDTPRFWALVLRRPEQDFLPGFGSNPRFAHWWRR
jgi:hypothetical protein